MLLKSCFIAGVCVVASTAANATTITVVDPSDANTAATLAAATLSASSGINIVSGSESYIGADGQGGLFTNFNLSNSTTSVTLPDGVILTSGQADIIQENTDTSFDHLSLGIAAPGTGSNAQLSQILADSGAPSTVTNDQNVLSFSFTVDDPTATSVSASFVFGTDEFPDQGVTDIFGLFVDGQNFAEFSDGSLISFQNGSPSEGFFNDNNVGSADPFLIEYDGFTNALIVTALLDPSLTTHTLVLAIADTSDAIFDSGVFFGGLQIGFADNGGITPSEVPLPAPALLLLTGLAGLGFSSRKKKLA